MAFTLGQAAKATGKTKAAIWQAIAANRLPALKDDHNRWQIEPEELFKLYPSTKPKARREEYTPDAKHLRAEIDWLKQLLSEAKVEREGVWDMLKREQQFTARLLGILTTDRARALQLEKWRQGTPTVIHVEPETPEQAPARKRWWQRGKAA